MFAGTFLVLYISLLLAVTSQNELRESHLINIDQGPVRGYKDVGEKFYYFYNIPFATVKERFQIAHPPPTWTEPFDAFYRGIVCPQFNITSLTQTNETVQEDCLVINVFVPDTNQTNLPVLFYVHGGMFYQGLGNLHRFISFIVSKNIIAVTFNYRIGLFGFLCLGTEKIPGNAGMKDQVLALRWVKRNIRNFGGNPDEITIAGCSAGGIAVDLLSISKATKGLFKRVIPHSGSNLDAFGVQMNPIEKAKEQARIYNFTNVDNIEALEEFFINLPVELVAQIAARDIKDNMLPNAPCVELDVGQEMFLDDSPYNILKKGEFVRYPILYGITDKEGSMDIQFIGEFHEDFNENFSDFLPGNLKFENEQEKSKVAQLVKRFYFGDKTIDEETLSSFIDFESDILFVYSTMSTIKLQVEAGNNEIYLYEYSYYDENTIVPGIGGAGHCAQARAIKDENETTMSEEYRNIKALLRTIWDNFIRTNNPVVLGYPVPSWPPMGLNRSRYLSVNTTAELRCSLLEERMRFWDTIYEKYYRQPLRPIWRTEKDSASRLVNGNICFIVCVSLFVVNKVV